jgi:hypothetical protein
MVCILMTVCHRPCTTTKIQTTRTLTNLGVASIPAKVSGAGRPPPPAFPHWLAAQATCRLAGWHSDVRLMLLLAEQEDEHEKSDEEAESSAIPSDSEEDADDSDVATLMKKKSTATNRGGRGGSLKIVDDDAEDDDEEEQEPEPKPSKVRLPIDSALA